MSFLWIDQDDYERAANVRDGLIPDELHAGVSPLDGSDYDGQQPEEEILTEGPTGIAGFRSGRYS